MAFVANAVMPNGAENWLVAITIKPKTNKMNYESGCNLSLLWGDEGKGKWWMFYPNYEIVARFQGGPNAGHTLKFEGEIYPEIYPLRNISNGK